MTPRGPKKVAVKRLTDDAQARWLELLNDEEQLPVEEAFTLSCAFVDEDGTRTSLR